MFETYITQFKAFVYRIKTLSTHARNPLIVIPYRKLQIEINSQDDNSVDLIIIGGSKNRS